MRKIDKTEIRSADYKEWAEKLENDNAFHPKYSATNRFYLDVMMSLYYCQRGLCAYTERRICELRDFKEEFWDANSFINDKPKHYGELDHFDPRLKKNKGWLWSNLFMVDGRINRLKLEQIVDEFLKPDLDDYDPFEIFEYDSKNHVYIASTEKFDEQRQSEINQMIFILGINYVVGPRSRYLNEKVQIVEEFKLETWDSIEIDEYPTAFTFIVAEKRKI